MFLDLGPRTVLAFRGPDAVRYLNGQVTNDVTRLAPGTALHACVTDAKGRLQAEVRIFRGPDDSLFVEAPPELRESLEARLTRYLVADDVEVADLSADWHPVHLLDSTGRCLLQWQRPAAALVLTSKRLGPPGHDLWLPGAGAAAALESLRSLAASCDPAQAEAIRIRHGRPAWGKELVPGMLPPEAGLDKTAISYTKGCYIGQEVISRVHSVGKLHRRLARFALDASPGAGQLEGATLLLPSTDTPAGTITSASPESVSPPGTRPCLGFLDRRAGDSGTFDVLASDGTRYPEAAASANDADPHPC